MANEHHETTEVRTSQPVSGDVTRGLKFAIGVTASVLVLEVAGGLWARSLALLADAGHVFMDVFALSLSFGAIRLSLLPSTGTRTYGWHRAEIIAAFLNGLLLIAVSFEVFHKAYERILAPQKVLTQQMIAVAVVGLVANLVVSLRLRTGHSHDLNVRSAYFHVLGDLVSSFGVVAGGVVMLVTKWYLLDSLLGILIGLIVLGGAVRVLLESGHILLEGVPRGVKLEDVVCTVRQVPKVKAVHDVHIWSVCSHILSLSCHVTVESGSPPEFDRIVEEIGRVLKERFRITHTTIQVDCIACSEETVSQDLTHISDHETRTCRE